MASNDSVSPNMEGCKVMEPCVKLQHSRPLVSIDYVRVKDIRDGIDDDDRIYYPDIMDEEPDEEDPGDEEPALYGTVIVTDRLGDDVVYHQYDGDFDYSSEYITLIGPSRPISALQTFCITLYLWATVFVRVNGGTMRRLMTKEICQGEVVWDPKTQHQSSYDKPLQQDVSGKYGRVTVGYSVITKALSAAVKVVLVINKSPTQIYGTIKASTSTSTRPRPLYDSSTAGPLYDSSRHGPLNGLPLQVERSLPLSCPTFPVALHSYLEIAVDLWDLWNDDRSKIAMGSVQFTPILGCMKSIIIKNQGEVQVYVTWE